MKATAFNKYNNIVGWVVFAIAALTYILTLEPSTSLWDCGEFISCAYKLQVPHPPGAPMFLLVYRFFTLFAPAPESVAYMTNLASGLNSAFTILFLFWTITLLAIKLVKPAGANNQYTAPQLISILGAGAVGALAYTFSDTFWFSAVEAEVYAMSSMFTALLFWLALKWERRYHEPRSSRYLVLIFFLIGVVIGVHLLGLLVIPIIIVMYYFKRTPTITWRGFAVAVGVGMLALGIVQIVTIQYLLKWASRVELLFVNSFGLPFWSGIIFFMVALVGALFYFIVRSRRRGQFYLNLSLTCYLAVLIGYSSYATSVIRSSANPSIDMNDPEDVFSYIFYLSREQYGDNYLLSGPNYTAFLQQNIQNGSVQTEEYGMNYRKEGKKYVKTGPKRRYKFAKQFTQFFPRMTDQNPDKFDGYRYWAWNDESKARADEAANNIGLARNISFLVNYQLYYMYWRYFAWNFIGRQNDVQGIYGELHQGNWITGIPFIDRIITKGLQIEMPPRLAANKAMNKLYGLPFILGMIGFFYHIKRNRRDTFLVFFLFLMTGIAILIYTNIASPQPRERDYAVVGSFYAFAIWIGLGVLAIIDWLGKKKPIPGPAIPVAVTAVCMLAVPVLMAAQEWDDHDRSKRTAVLDYAINYLESCGKDAVFFTNADNDTYPLWYAQEVEGIRADVRVINLNLLPTDWYANQMRQNVNGHPNGLKFTLTEKDLVGWDGLYGGPSMSDLPVPFSEQIAAIHQEAERGGMNPNAPLLSTKFSIPLTAQSVANSYLKPTAEDRVPAEIIASVGRNVYKGDLLVLDFILTNNFKRPICFSATSVDPNFLGLGKFLRRTGLAYQLVPFETLSGEEAALREETMYANVMKKWKWGQLDKHESYVDYVLMRGALTNRGVMSECAMKLSERNKMAKAVALADLALAKIPDFNVPYDFRVAEFVLVYHRAGETEKAKALANKLADIYMKGLNYFSQQKMAGYMRGRPYYDVYQDWQGMQTLYSTARLYKDEAFIKKYEADLQRYTSEFGLSENMRQMLEQQQGMDSYFHLMLKNYPIDRSVEVKMEDTPQTDATRIDTINNSDIK